MSATCASCGKELPSGCSDLSLCPDCKMALQDNSTTRSTQVQSNNATPVPQLPGYRFIRLLGSGGQGDVWQAIRLEDSRKIAVKLIRPDRRGDQHIKARFEQERQTLELLDHPNIVRVYEHGEMPDGELWYSMEYVVGRPLNEQVHLMDQSALAGVEKVAAGTFPLTPVLELFVQVCEAVQAAHQVGVIHRDLKPANILVDDDGIPTVLDFGLAKPPEPQSPDVVTLTGEFLGSPAWFSPEQVEGQPGRIDVRTDVYSLGVVLYNLLTGTFPYDVHRPMAEIFDAIRHAEPVPPSTVVTWLDDELQTIILKAITKQRERRYQSVGELREDIQRYLDGQPVLAKGDSRGYILKKLVQRHKAFVAAAVIVVVLSVGFGMVMSVVTAKAVDAKHEAITANQEAETRKKQAEDAQQKAEASDAEARRLLAESHEDAARLSVQRGDWKSALRHYDAAIEENHPNEIALEPLLPCPRQPHDLQPPKPRPDSHQISREVRGLLGTVGRGCPRLRRWAVI